MRNPDFSQEQPASRRPHAVAPHTATVRVLMVSYRTRRGNSSGGISVCSNSTARVLRYRAHLQVDCWEVESLDDLMRRLEREEYHNPRPVTHVVLNTPNWDPDKVLQMAQQWADIDFVQHNHSGLSYLDLDHNGEGLGRIRRFLDLQTTYRNIRVAANNQRIVDMFYDAFRQEVLYLPNLYYWETMPHAIQRHDYDPLRIGSFGIGRDWKNQPVAAEAAVALAQRKNVFVELHVNIDPHNDYYRVRNGRQKLVGGLPNVKLVEHEWKTWADFRRLVRTMDLLLSPSYDETFCNICADGILEGVPSVGTDAMEWLPLAWRARAPFDQASVVATAMTLLYDPIGAIRDGRRSLEEYVSNGVNHWVGYLTR